MGDEGKEIFPPSFQKHWFYYIISNSIIIIIIIIN